MKLAAISNYQLWIKGTAPLPAGAVPLAAEGAGIICLMPTGRWIMWLAGVAQSRPPETQKAVLEVIIPAMGGTAGTVAESLGVSPRTVEAWRSGKNPLPVKMAYLLASKMAESKA